MVVGGLPRNQCRNRNRNRLVDHYLFVISNQIKFYFVNVHEGMVPLACPRKGKGFSLSLEVFTFTL